MIRLHVEGALASLRIAWLKAFICGLELTLAALPFLPPAEGADDMSA